MKKLDLINHNIRDVMSDWTSGKHKDLYLTDSTLIWNLVESQVVG